MDGFYTLSSSTKYFSWHDTEDHTPNDVDGKALIVNASESTVGEFFRYEIDGLCENTTYEFSAWLMNLLPLSGCLNDGIPINVRFEIWDDTDTELIAGGNTGDINGTTSPQWNQYGLVFPTPIGKTSVILKMINNSIGGCGNDLAIDDIQFKTCGDITTVFDDSDNEIIEVCIKDAPISINLEATPDGSVFDSYVYQWQRADSSSDWEDIPGATDSVYSEDGIMESGRYRVRIAEDPINIGNEECSTVSKEFEVLLVATPSPPTKIQDVMACSNDPAPLEVSTLFGIKVNWYDAPSGGNLLLADSHTYQPTANGTFYAEAETSTAGCISDTRTAVSIFFYQLPEVDDETIAFCEGSQTTLNANYMGSDTVSYEWDTGETTSQITVGAPGTYTVGVTNSDGCTNVKTINLKQVDAPIISNITSDEFTIIVSTTFDGDFEYSLNGVDYQDSPEFENTQGGRYTIYVREKNGCGETSSQYTHFVIPKFFTPNGDTFNDTFVLTGIENYNSSQVNIFDRYGKLLINSRNTPFSWDGTFNNRDLPSGDYWYMIQIEDTIFKGHFSLKR